MIDDYGLRVEGQMRAVGSWLWAVEKVYVRNSYPGGVCMMFMGSSPSFVISVPPWLLLRSASTVRLFFCRLLLQVAGSLYC
jgi:hypothetical protein